MDCFESRLLLNADPATPNPALLAHLESCPACQAIAKNQIGLSQQLAQAVQIPVPEGLASRILLRQNLSEQTRTRQRKVRMYALAASVILAVSVTVGMITLHTPQTLDVVALNHVKAELKHLSDKNDIQLASVNSLLHGFNMQLRAVPGKVNYVGACAIRKINGVHMIVQGDAGPVTILFMPGEYAKQRQPFNDSRFSGVILPTPNGSIAIIGEAKEPLPVIEQQLQAEITYI
jgi:hypothetical protein